jgi:hypothetical protein
MKSKRLGQDERLAGFRTVCVISEMGTKPCDTKNKEGMLAALTMCSF